MDGDKLPVMFRAERFRDTTRGAFRVLQSTPRQSQNERESSLHESRAPAGSESSDLRPKRACRSVSDALRIMDVATEHALANKMTIATSRSKGLFVAPTLAILLVDASMLWVR
jgi:hypothetical protein